MVVVYSEVLNHGIIERHMTAKWVNYTTLVLVRHLNSSEITTAVLYSDRENIPESQ